MPYAVLQTLVQQPSLDQLVRIYASVEGLTDLDAAHRAGDAVGILGINLDGADAKALWSAARGAGIETSIVDQSVLTQLPPARKVKRCDCLDRGIELYDSMGRQRVLAWKDVRIVGVGWIARRQVSQQDLPIYMGETGGPFPVVREATAVTTIVDLFVCDDPRRLRLDASELLYHYLGASAPSDPMARFDILVRDLTRGAGDALINSGAEYLIAEGEHRLYRSMPIFERELVWLHWIQNEAAAQDSRPA